MSFDFQERTNKLLQRLRYLGAWFTEDKISFNSYLMYVILIYVYHNLHNLIQTIHLCYHYNDLSELATSGLITFVEIFTNIKAFGVISNRETILKFNSRVAKRNFQPRNKEQEKIVRETFKIFDVFYVIHCIGPSSSVIGFGLMPISELIAGRRKLPFDAEYPYNHKKSPFFELTYFHQISSLLIQANTHVHVDCLAMNLIAILVAQVEILADNLKRISKKNLNMDQELIDCIKHHKDILLCFRDVYRILNLIMFGQFFITSLSLCLASLELATVGSGSPEFTAIIVYEISLAGELLMYCWWGNYLIEKSELLPQAAFESGWIEGSINFQKNLSFFIFRSQKEMVLYAVDFFKISLSSFILILKNSYSFYAVLHHVNNNKIENK